MNVLGLIAVLVIVGLVFSGICLAAELTDSLTQASAQNELNTVTSFTADDNLNVRITNVDATKFQAYFAYKGKTSMNPIASGLVNAGGYTQHKFYLYNGSSGMGKWMGDIKLRCGKA